MSASGPTNEGEVGRDPLVIDTPTVILALDFGKAEEALELVERLGPEVGFYKVGLELFSTAGPDFVGALKSLGKDVFLDLKLYDIPNTVAGAVASAARSGADLLTVHATGGRPMLEAAAEAAAAAATEGSPIRLLGVTVLTSLSPMDIEVVWGRSIRSLRDEVIRLSALALEAGLDGVVASAQEAHALRRRLGPDPIVVTPGIRLPGEATHDQERVATPALAAAAGADYLVVGRSVTRAADPVKALEAIQHDLETAPAG